MISLTTACKIFFILIVQYCSLVLGLEYPWYNVLPVCHDNGYKPKHGIRKPPIHLGLQFLNGSKLRYVCDVNYKLVPAITTQVCINGNWVPSAPPTCIADVQCMSQIVVHNGVDWSNVPVPIGTVVFAENIDCYIGYKPDLSVPNSTCTSSGSWSNDLWCHDHFVQSKYCRKPPDFLNGISLCCHDPGMSFNHSDFCCPPGGSVQFECDPGFILTFGELEWKCTPSYSWDPGRVLPTCTQVVSPSPTHPNHSQISDGMVKTLVGVVTGVLTLLLIVVAFAFCKPRLKDIKRRWRDIRDDEHGLIVDGRRVNLPTYEQATSSHDDRGWSDLYHQLSGPPPLNYLASSQLSNQITPPPVSNLSENDVASTSYQSPPANGVLSSEAYRGERSTNESIWFDGDVPSTSRDQITALEFLRESSTSTSSRDASAEFAPLEDSFAPLPNRTPSSFVPPLPRSPSSSLSSNEAVSAPLLPTTVLNVQSIKPPPSIESCGPEVRECNSSAMTSTRSDVEHAGSAAADDGLSTNRAVGPGDQLHGNTSIHDDSVVL